MRTSLLQTKTNSRQRSKRVAVWLLLAVVVVLVLLFFREPLGSVASYGAVPMRQAVLASDTMLGRVWGYIRGVDALIAERDALEEALRTRDAKLAAQAGVRSDAALLGEVAADRMHAGVLFAPNYTPYDTLIIDRGREAGIRAGNLVYAPGDIVIGVVEEAYRASSLVVLFSTPGVPSRVYVHGPDVAAHAVGMGGGVIRISIPQGLDVAAGDAVVLPTLSPSIFGTISSVEADPTRPDAYAFVTLPIALSHMRFVSIDTGEYTAPSREEIESILENTGASSETYFNWPAETATST